jgi:hypothetical protein
MEYPEALRRAISSKYGQSYYYFGEIHPPYQPSWLRLRRAHRPPSDDPTANRSCYLAPKKPRQMATNLTGGLREMPGRRKQSTL